MNSEPLKQGASEAAPRGWALKITPSGSGFNRLADALSTNELVIGWSDADFTVLPQEWDAFRNAVLAMAPDQNAWSVGQQAGNMWRFVVDMKPGDLVAVPDGGNVYVAEVNGPAHYDAVHHEHDAPHRRPCEWLNDKRPLRRDDAESALIKSLKARQACVSASYEAIVDLLDYVDGSSGDRPLERSPLGRFPADLTSAVLNVLRDKRAHLSDWRAEAIVAGLFRRLGASDVRIPPRRVDVGADVVANFEQLGLKIVAQVKYHTDPQWKTSEGALQQLMNGMDAESADVGWLITWGEFPFDKDQGDALAEGRNIRLIDGRELAGLLVEAGLGATGSPL